MIRKSSIAFAFAAALGMTGAQAQDGVTIGVLADLSASSVDIGGPGSVAAVEMAVKDFGGTVLGKPITVVSADHQMKPDIGSAIAAKWFDAEGVDVIVDVPVSSVALAVAKIAQQRNKLLMVTAATVSALTGAACSPNTIHWSDDTNALARGTTNAAVKSGFKSWYFISVDFVFGHQLETAAREVIEEHGGKFLGSVRVPLNTSDYSSFVLQAQASKAQVVGLNVVGSDFINAVRQASEFGLVAGGQKLLGFLVYISDIHSLGLKSTQGLLVTESFYWDTNDKTRAFAKRFMAVRKVMPTKVHAMNYAAVTHYLNAVKATGNEAPAKTVAWMKANPTDFFGQEAKIRADGRVMFDLVLYQVKSPAESKYPWDYYKTITPMKGADAFAPMVDKCNFAKK